MTNDYSDQPKKEIEWDAVLNEDGSQKTAKDGMGIVASEPMLVTPKLQGEFGGWILIDTASGMDIEGGFWENPRRPTKAPLEVDVPVLVTLSLGGKKSTGKRYQNINDVEPAPGSQPQTPNQPTQVATQPSQSVSGTYTPAPATATPVGIDRDSSIREQAFFNNLTPAMLDLLPPEQQAAFIRAYFDTGMLMMRPAVRKRALDTLEEGKSESQARPEPISEPTTKINEDEQITEFKW